MTVTIFTFHTIAGYQIQSAGTNMDAARKSMIEKLDDAELEDWKRYPALVSVVTLEVAS